MARNWLSRRQTQQLCLQIGALAKNLLEGTHHLPLGAPVNGPRLGLAAPRRETRRPQVRRPAGVQKLSCSRCWQSWLSRIDARRASTDPP